MSAFKLFWSYEMPGYRPISEDLRELLSLLNSHHVEFVVVGSHALAFHGVPRFTEDIDFFISREKANVEKLAKALKEFGVELDQSAQEDMVSKPRGVIFIGRKPNRADFLNFLDGVTFQQVERTKVLGELAGQLVSYISLPDFVATKQASGREKDLSDLTLLRSVLPDEAGP